MAYRFITKQQIAVYKMAHNTAQGSENVRLEVVEQEKGIHKATLITDGYVDPPRS